MSKNLLENYCNKIDELAPATFNEDQKILAKKILEKADEKDLQNIFQMLIQRIKIGFTFDVAPTYQKEDEQSVALLKKDENRSFKNYENTSNIENTLIIGENYDALKNLLVIERERESSSHSDAYYDVIYIDPPYNTESAKDDGNHLADEKSDIAPSKFVYRDKFSRNGWLNMLNERLRLAKQLLKDDGVIFVSIDDNEQAYLKVLMDEIFGEENFIALFPRKTTPHRAAQEKYVNTNCDYIICYSLNKFLIKGFNKIINKKIDGNVSIDKYGRKFILGDTRAIIASKNQGYVKSLDYDITFNKKTFSPILKDGTRFRWLWSKERFESAIKNDIVVESKNGLRAQIYLDYIFEEKTNILLKKDNTKVIINTSEFVDSIESWNNVGTQEINEIFMNNSFLYPKPTLLIKKIINLHCNKNARILDFYAGSGTTGHAVMELNREDGGNRTYTLVTNNENNVGYDVCYERLYRINNGIGTKSETFEWTNKNKSYKQNLNVFSIDYYDTSILKKDDNDSITKIKKALAKEIEEFGITPSTNFNVDIYYDLLSLKPVKRDVSNAK